ncbi:Xaa-Pro aminopeptidase [Thalassobacillus cyri]|uniref:Xaa-Pro aminopeptidase n=1 Tax=Thalassobacillus cyri TaxID=571932 RepID=A0A1H3XH39_9BACI|nr:M24 family metallopeptidase [Thalassobacillus cyri]SDZ97984.1 Xaa-Pro aminopeptidase [Thalassobacillus cyri]
MNIDKLREFLKKQKVDGILLRRRNNFSWVTEGRYNHIVRATEIGVADLIITQDKAYLVTAKMEESRLTEEEVTLFPFDCEVVSDDWFVDITPKIEALTEGLEMVTDTPFKDWEVVDDELIEIRSVLNEQEIEKYRALCQQAAEAVEETCREIFQGQTEHEIEALLASKVLPLGIKPHVILVATDERIRRYRHPIPTNKKLEKHAMIVICAEKHGLIANVTRMVHFGQLSEELLVNEEKVQRIDAVMNLHTLPGTRVGKIIDKGIEQYEKEGYPEDWKLLHQGGLTGFNPREYLAAPTSEAIIKTGQVFAWNPALTGVKSEDTILVTENGPEFLTDTDKWEYGFTEIDGEHLKRPKILIR